MTDDQAAYEALLAMLRDATVETGKALSLAENHWNDAGEWQEFRDRAVGLTRVTVTLDAIRGQLATRGLELRDLHK